MPDAIFAHPRLAAVYDAFDGARDDLTAYLGITDEVGAKRVLDVGCGTGCLGVLLADTGRTVMGVDPAEASLDVARSKTRAKTRSRARSKDEAGKVTWVHGDATTVPSFDADLAVMTGNVAQVFLTDEEWSQTLGGIHTALRPTGWLAFEVRRPQRRIWEVWAADDAHETLDVPRIGAVERRRAVTDVDLPFVSFRYTYRFLADGEVLVSESTLRFRDRDEIETALSTHGYQVRDVREAPDRPGLEFVFVAQRTP